jgi:hypothetical protein
MLNFSLKKLACLLVLSSSLVLPQLSVFAQKKVKIKIVNKSSWQLHHVYLSSSTNDKWGPDQLTETIVEPGDSFTITSIPCDNYDIKVVDEDGDACVVADVRFCEDDLVWNLTDKDLLDCNLD